MRYFLISFTWTNPRDKITNFLGLSKSKVYVAASSHEAFTESQENFHGMKRKIYMAQKLIKMRRGQLSRNFDTEISSHLRERRVFLSQLGRSDKLHQYNLLRFLEL